MHVCVWVSVCICMCVEKGTWEIYLIYLAVIRITVFAIVKQIIKNFCLCVETNKNQLTFVFNCIDLSATIKQERDVAPW